MRILARLCLAAGGLTLALSASASAQAPAPHPASQGEYSVPTGVVVTGKNSREVEAQLRRLGPPQVVSETVVIDGQTYVSHPSGSAPGRAVVSDAPGFQMAMPGEPEPVGVMRTNYANSNPGMVPPAMMGAPGSSPFNPAMGRHGVASGPGAGSAPFLPPSSPNPRPRVIAHLFGLEGIGNMFRDAREAKIEARKRKEILSDYYASRKVDELPASAVYGRKPR